MKREEYEEINRIINEHIDKVKESYKPEVVKALEALVYGVLVEVEEYALERIE